MSFLISRISTYLLEIFIMTLFVSILKFDSDLWVIFWTLVSQGIVIISNYILSKLYVFKK